MRIARNWCVLCEQAHNNHHVSSNHPIPGEGRRASRRRPRPGRLDRGDAARTGRRRILRSRRRRPARRDSAARRRPRGRRGAATANARAAARGRDRPHARVHHLVPGGQHRGNRATRAPAPPVPHRYDVRPARRHRRLRHAAAGRRPVAGADVGADRLDEHRAGVHRASHRVDAAHDPAQAAAHRARFARPAESRVDTGRIGRSLGARAHGDHDHLADRGPPARKPHRRGRARARVVLSDRHPLPRRAGVLRGDRRRAFARLCGAGRVDRNPEHSALRFVGRRGHGRQSGRPRQDDPRNAAAAPPGDRVELLRRMPAARRELEPKRAPGRDQRGAGGAHRRLRRDAARGAGADAGAARPYAVPRILRSNRGAAESDLRGAAERLSNRRRTARRRPARRGQPRRSSWPQRRLFPRATLRQARAHVRLSPRRARHSAACARSRRSDRAGAREARLAVAAARGAARGAARHACPGPGPDHAARRDGTAQPVGFRGDQPRAAQVRPGLHRRIHRAAAYRARRTCWRCCCSRAGRTSSTGAAANARSTSRRCWNRSRRSKMRATSCVPCSGSGVPQPPRRARRPPDRADRVFGLQQAGRHRRIPLGLADRAEPAARRRARDRRDDQRYSTAAAALRRAAADASRIWSRARRPARCAACCA